MGTPKGDTAKPIDRERTPLAEWPVMLLREEREKARKDVGLDTEKRRAYIELQKVIAQQEVALKKLEAEILRATGSVDRRKQLMIDRRESYSRLMETFIREEKILRDLYAPLKSQLEGAVGALKKLQFLVRRQVDLDAWVDAGEKLLDLRRSSVFHGRGTLKQKAEEHLFERWERGSAREVSDAMHDFLEHYGKALVAAQPTQATPEDDKVWTQKIASWLYDTDHIAVKYSIEYDGIEIERLSPGTRGIVLLLLYLAIDKQDLRPLLIDQPEENLDPKSVFDELVPYFREARKRRQVIIVTHNPNLVVNADAEQVIIASAVTDSSGGLPSISYRSGSLENTRIRETVCETLEGGRRAFLDRARRYRLRIEPFKI